MKFRSMLVTFALLALAAAPPPLTPAPVTSGPAWPNTAKPALWVVHGAKGTVYLFGSIHLLPSGVEWSGGPVARAFDASDTLELEIATPDPATLQPLMLRLAASPDGAVLATKLRPATIAALDKMVGPTVSASHYQPWFAGLMVSLVEVMKLGLDPEQGVEKTLTHRAEAAHKPVEGIETAEEQLNLFAHLPQPRQIAFLEEALDEANDAPVEMHAMVDDWARGDPDALAVALNKGLDADPDLKAVLLTERNAKFAHWVAKRIDRPGTVFMAVGAGHLAGTGSVQADLTAMGLKVERLQ